MTRSEEITSGKHAVDLLTVQAELLARESIFHKPVLGTSRKDYAA
jgi:hypothetical protein